MGQSMQALPRQQAMALQAQMYWNEKLHWTKEDEKEAAKRPSRKRRPLAPADLTKMGLIDAENYAEQEELFGEFCSLCPKIRLAELRQAGMIRENAEVEVKGAGTARDLAWLERALQLKLLVCLQEISSVACDNFEALIETMGAKSRVCIDMGDIEEEWGEPHENTQIAFASQFVMILTPAKMRRVMALMGSTLRHSRKNGIPSLIWLVHPLPEDNREASEYAGRMIVPSRPETRSRPYRTWGKDTTLYPAGEIVGATEKGYGGKISCKTIATHRYYHQTYSFLELEPDE